MAPTDDDRNIELIHLDQRLRQIEERRRAELQRSQESLPVLGAFQEFLDTERRKSQRRMTALSVIFALVLVAITGGGYMAFRHHLGTVKGDFVDLKEQAEAYADLSTEHSKTTRVALSGLQSRLSDIRRSVRSDQQEFAGTQSNLLNQVEDYEAHLAKLQKALLIVASRNTKLKKELASMDARWPELSSELEALKKEVEAQSREPLPPPVHDTTAQVADTRDASPRTTREPANAGSQSVAMIITPQGEKHGIRWRLPAPISQE